jgi:RNA polymerase sigma factor (sigma-70 family)
MDMSIQHALQRPEGMPQGPALRDFLVANYERLRQRLARRLGCGDLAADCLHDTWLRLGDLGVAQAVQAPEAYVFRMACNAAVDQLRANRHARQGGEIELDQLIDPAPGPELISESRSRLQAVDRAMQRLPRRHRAVLEALRIEEMTRHEVASRYGLSLRSVDTALQQALSYCARHSGQQVLAGPSTARRPLR